MGVMLSLTVLIAAALLTSTCAVLRVPRSAPGARRWKAFSDSSLVLACTGIIALSSLLFAVHVDLGMSVG
ncbi:hypothetical protein [Arthrobacter rhizosphaerae]|uniref:hypothetical protein n=1 Tax=Arthrobacter rhizosphaerae TaxID=2855490 RepID=UPI001FF69E32|nr:hypothetical protein [Arthrobacter rhizosphaerae]